MKTNWAWDLGKIVGSDQKNSWCLARIAALVFRPFNMHVDKLFYFLGSIHDCAPGFPCYLPEGYCNCILLHLLIEQLHFLCVRNFFSSYRMAGSETFGRPEKRVHRKKFPDKTFSTKNISVKKTSLSQNVAFIKRHIFTKCSSKYVIVAKRFLKRQCHEILVKLYVQCVQ